MNRIQIDAPCKVNLSLDIVGKLPNGYHEMDMVMQTVSLCDTISLQLQPGSGQIQMSCRFEPDNGVPLSCEDLSCEDLSCGEDNIAVRCARAFFRESGCPLQGHDLSIQLVKRIPMMAGLGGGSADGAAVLSGLNLLTGANLPLEQLEKSRCPAGRTSPSACGAARCAPEGLGSSFSRCRRCRTFPSSSSSPALASAPARPLPAATASPTATPRWRK